MEDYLVRVIAKEAGIRGLACVTTHIVQEGSRRHETRPTATAALGRALTGAALVGALLKVGQRVALKFAGDGPLQKIVAEADSYGKVRGYLSVPEVDLPQKLGHNDVGRALGFGTLTVVKDLKLKELAEGRVSLATGEIDDDIALYLNKSEQNLSAVELGVVMDEKGQVQVAGGLLIQAIPDKEEPPIHALAERIQEMPPIEMLLKEGQTPEEILALVFGEIAHETLEHRPLIFKCTCSWERSEKALISLGREELLSLIEEGEAIVDCHFCHERYTFEENDLRMLLDQIG